MNWTKFYPPRAWSISTRAPTPNDYFIGGLSGPGYMYPNHHPGRPLSRC